MKTKLTKRSLCIALVVVMILGLAVINAGACSCSYEYWHLYEPEKRYFYLDANKHDVMQEDWVYCTLCQDEFLYCTHWYSEDHYFENTYLRYDDSIQMYVYQERCKDCGFSDIFYLPYYLP